MIKNEFNEIADKLVLEVKSKTTSKSMKVKTLLGLFNYEKRTEEITTIITELLAERDVVINPSIMKLGDNWQMSWEDRICLSVKEEILVSSEPFENIISTNWNNDGWFDLIKNKDYRTEKEVETKFIIPLLFRLGYSEDDRYDGMNIEACHGSKPTRLEIDFALFNKDEDILCNQVLLIAEAKKEERLQKEVELDKAQKQAKSYAFWLSCSFGLVTDSRKIQVLDLFGSIDKLKKPLFECTRDDLKERFAELYNLISKETLTKHYVAKVK